MTLELWTPGVLRQEAGLAFHHTGFQGSLIKALSAYLFLEGMGYRGFIIYLIFNTNKGIFNMENKKIYMYKNSTTQLLLIINIKISNDLITNYYNIF